MAEECQTQSIRDRINAFNIAGKTEHLGRAPITAYTSDGKISDRPSLDQRSQSANVPVHTRTQSNALGNEPNGSRRDGVLPPPTNISRTGQLGQQPVKPIPPPRLPPRRQSTQPSPALPPRRPSDQLNRKASNESVSSTISTISSISTMSNGTTRTGASRTASMDVGRVKAPMFNQSSLPPLPPKRTKDQIEARYSDAEKSKVFPEYKEAERRRLSKQRMDSSSSVTSVETLPTPLPTPALPPRRESRPEQSTPSSRKLSPPSDEPSPKPPRSALSYAMNKEAKPETNGILSNQSSPQPSTANSVPPPVPFNSRPDLSKLQALKANPQSATQIPQTVTPIPSQCLLCRDFSLVDAHAAKFPRQQVTSLDWLANQLTTSFPSATDKARSIFTWLHHNIAYDTVSFFAGNVQPSTPISTLQSGLAVCQGYAGLFTALASKAGLESIVVSGHGKGFGFASLAPGSPLPQEAPSGHAWNVVKIDNGHWKLIDPCWGAGHVNGAGQPYTKCFKPRMFTMPNTEFGLRHFPSNRNQFYVDTPPLWSEYILGPLGGAESVKVYSGVAESEGVSETSFVPSQRNVSISPSTYSGPTVRFQFSRICEHWDPVRNGIGKSYVFILQIHGVDGREKDFVPFETNGMFWWVDVEPRQLGCKGQTVSAYTVESVGWMT